MKKMVKNMIVTVKTRTTLITNMKELKSNIDLFFEIVKEIQQQLA